MVSCATLVFTFLYASFGLNLVNGSSLEINQYFTTQKTDTITIGLLIESAKKDRDVLQAAQLAVLQANKSETRRGKYFKLKHRATEGPWGQASSPQHRDE